MCGLFQAPVIPSVGPINLESDASGGDSIYLGEATDQDAGTTLVYSMVERHGLGLVDSPTYVTTESNDFEIDSATGNISISDLAKRDSVGTSCMKSLLSV